MLIITSSHVNSVTVASSISTRLRHVASRIHAHGPLPLYHLLCELSASPAALDRLEAYAALDVDTLDRFGGHDLPPLIRLLK